MFRSNQPMKNQWSHLSCINTFCWNLWMTLLCATFQSSKSIRIVSLLNMGYCLQVIYEHQYLRIFILDLFTIIYPDGWTIIFGDRRCHEPSEILDCCSYEWFSLRIIHLRTYLHFDPKQYQHWYNNNVILKYR